MTFSELELAEPLLRAVSMENYQTPSPIQQQAIPHLLAGRDLLGCAQTGTGKTAAFALPIMHGLHKNINSERGRLPRALVLAPTRELAAQVAASFTTYGRFTGLKTVAIFGGVSQVPQAGALKKGVDVVVATPGRLVDLIRQRLCDLRGITTLVLDEADHMLDLGFIHDVKFIISRVPAKRQTLLFSATMPREIAELATSVLTEPVKVTVTPVSSTVETVAQSVYHVEKSNKGKLLVELLQSGGVENGLVFSRTKHGADKICKMLNTSGIKAGAIHGNKSQTARKEALGAFKSGKLRVLVATDIAARGIDIHGLSHVVNYDLPDVPETYVHRIGRTGRAGRSGAALSFCDTTERGSLRDIERLISSRIPAAQHRLSVSGDSRITEAAEKRTHEKTSSAPAGGKNRWRRSGERTPVSVGAGQKSGPGKRSRQYGAKSSPGGSPRQATASRGRYSHK